MQKECIPVLLGGDLNCYGLSRAFYEAYGIPTVAFGRQLLGAVRHSRYVFFRTVPGLSEHDVCRAVLLDFANETRDKTRLLLPCTDEYARFLIENRDILSAHYMLPLPDNRALPLFEKTAFYEMCDRFGVPYPETIVFSTMPTMKKIAAVGERLGYPHIIKPSASDVYWHYPFAGMEKVYLAHNKHEAECILSLIFGSGYPLPVLCQRYIGGGDSASYTLTMYFDKDGRLAMRACAHVLLEEHTPRGKGNYAAMMTAPIPPVAHALAHMLNSVGYRGFANVDLRRAKGVDYALEVNLRPGRSSYFLAAAGASPATLVYRDHVLGETLSPMHANRPALFRTVPFSVVWQYSPRESDAHAARELYRRGLSVSLLHAPADLRYNPRRALYVAAHMRREVQKFRRYAVRHR